MSAALDHLSASDIVIEPREPRHRLDNPVLLAWASPSDPEVGSEIEWGIDLAADGVAHVVCRDVYHGSDPESVTSEAIPATEPIPRQLARALSRYTGRFGPIETIVNPVEDAGSDV